MGWAPIVKTANDADGGGAGVVDLDDAALAQHRGQLAFAE
jgi:hypothetical protein